MKLLYVLSIFYGKGSNMKKGSTIKNIAGYPWTRNESRDEKMSLKSTGIPGPKPQHPHHRKGL